MADDQDDPRPGDQLADQLDRIERTAVQARDEARKAREESEDTNGRLRGVEQDLYGPEETRKREHSPGLIGEFRRMKSMVYDLAGARDESEAVARAMKWIIGIGVTMVGSMIAVLALLIQIVGA